MFELCPHDATVTMGTHDSTPHDSVLAWLLLPALFGLAVGTVDISHSLPQIKWSVFLVRHSFQFQKGCVRSLVAQTTFVAHKNPLCVQPDTRERETHTAMCTISCHNHMLGRSSPYRRHIQ